MTARGSSRRTGTGGQSFVKGVLLAGAALYAITAHGGLAHAQESLGGLGVNVNVNEGDQLFLEACLLYTSPSPRDRQKSRMPSSA